MQVGMLISYYYSRIASPSPALRASVAYSKVPRLMFSSTSGICFVVRFGFDSQDLSARRLFFAADRSRRGREQNVCPSCRLKSALVQLGSSRIDRSRLMKGRTKALSVTKELLVLLFGLTPIPGCRIKQRANIETAMGDSFATRKNMETPKVRSSGFLFSMNRDYGGMVSRNTIVACPASSVRQPPCRSMRRTKRSLPCLAG
jgi:hypothetical protein